LAAAFFVAGAGAALALAAFLAGATGFFAAGFEVFLAAFTAFAALAGAFFAAAGALAADSAAELSPTRNAAQFEQLLEDQLDCLLDAAIWSAGAHEARKHGSLPWHLPTGYARYSGFDQVRHAHEPTKVSREAAISTFIAPDASFELTLRHLRSKAE
jgi:hypothetical protein